MIIPLAIIFGIVPSLIWLAFYLRTDVHPEPNRMIIKVFFWGMLVTIPAVLIELGLLPFLKSFALSETITFYLYIFIVIALVEEVLKYGVFHFVVLHNKALDEAIDVPLYMIISALGFAALENIFILFGLGFAAPGGDVLALSAFRFVGATLLHALVSGTFGYFIAISILNPRQRLFAIPIGLGVATFLHGLFNIYIIKGQGVEQLLYPVLILTGLGIFLFVAFKYLKRITTKITT
ncbi:MAG: PrsW family intramembrane metalloprotease [Patescibacteria group bacterium]|nr:PrsW family intramembrane metalloprotease [Patescibacteria group bacterium]